MPMPFTYRHATDEFRAFLAGLRKETLIPSDNVIYTGTDALFRSFRARLRPDQAAAFAGLLQDWEITAEPRPWPDRESLRAEMLALRADHNFCPPDLLEPLLAAIAATMRQVDLERVLARIGPQAVAFWSVAAD